MREFIIKENSVGRYHLKRFGISCGGRNRIAPFIFIVQDGDGREVARSSRTTARKLGVAEAGRGHYDADTYWRIDFLKVVDGQLVPWARQAKRVAWEVVG